MDIFSSDMTEDHEMDIPEFGPKDLEDLRTAVLSNNVALTEQWFESHGFHSDNGGEDITRVTCDSRNELVNLLIEAVRTHKDDTFNAFLKYTCHTSVLHHARNIDDKLLSHIVLSRGSVASLRSLSGSGYDVNIRDSDGMTPLLYLIYRKSVYRVKDYQEKLDYLVHNADVNRQGADNWSFAPLHIAVLYSTGTETVKTLLEAGADVNQRCNNSLSTPLYFAVERAMPDIVDLLFEHEADPFVVDVLGDTPLHGAVVQGKKGFLLLKMFVKWNAPMNIKNSSGQTPLLWLLSDSRTVKKSRIMLLLQAGCTCSSAEWWRICEEGKGNTKLETKLREIETLMDFYVFTPRSLHDLACFKIRHLLGRKLPTLAPLLPLPDCLRRRVMLDHYFAKY